MTDPPWANRLHRRLPDPVVEVAVAHAREEDPWLVASARAGNRRFGPPSAPRAHTKAPYKMDFLWKTLMPLNRP